MNAYEERSFEVIIYSNTSSQNSEFCCGELNVMVSFTNKQSIMRLIKHIINIPLGNVLRHNSPQKDGMFKVTLSALKPIDFTQMITGKFS